MKYYATLLCREKYVSADLLQTAILGNIHLPFLARICYLLLALANLLINIFAVQPMRKRLAINDFCNVTKVGKRMLVVLITQVCKYMMHH